MDATHWNVDRIVCEVLKRLRETSGDASAPRAACKQAVAAGSDDPPASTGELVIADRVITLAAIAGRLEGVRRIAVPPGAVITPAVRDELVKRNVAVARRAAPEERPAEMADLVVGVAETDCDWAELAGRIGRCRAGVATTVTGDLSKVVGEVAVAVSRRGCLGMILTAAPEVALCLANRRRGVRAALGSDPATVARAVRTIGANLLVVDPHRRSMEELAETIGRFTRGGPRPCPPQYRKLFENTED